MPAVAANAASIRIDRVAFRFLINPRLGSAIRFADVGANLQRLEIAEHLIQASVERMTRRRRQVRDRDPHRWLPRTLAFAHRHAKSLVHRSNRVDPLC